MAGVVYNHIPQLSEKLRKAGSQIVRTTGFKVERYAKQFAARDTSFMANSIYTVTEDQSTNRHPAPTHRSASLFSDVTHTAPGRALVLVGAKYGLFQELGTGHMRAHPFMLPAADRARPEFLDAWRKLEELLR